MKLGDICSAPCFAHAAGFVLPASGCQSQHLKFADSDGRKYYAVLLCNHDRRNPNLNPKLAVVGLSPAANQIDEFVREYAKTGSYVEASIQGAFAGLAPDIIAMFQGGGLTERLRLKFSDPNSLARHPDIYATSLVGCASLQGNGSSNDFDPAQYEGARRCVADRARALYPADVTAWVQASQPKAWEALTKSHGASTEDVHCDRIRKQLDARGTLDVLRHGVEIIGLRQPVTLAQFKPALAMNIELMARYGANRLVVPANANGVDARYVNWLDGSTPQYFAKAIRQPSGSSDRKRSHAAPTCL